MRHKIKENCNLLNLDGFRRSNLTFFTNAKRLSWQKKRVICNYINIVDRYKNVVYITYCCTTIQNIHVHTLVLCVYVFMHVQVRRPNG